MNISPEIIAIMLIVISAILKGIALKNLSNKSWEFDVRKKKYMTMNIASYIFLLPGFLILVYVYFLK